jgi:hypothetical protein
MELFDFRIGDTVEKYTGDYQLSGVVRAAFYTGAGKARYVIEHFPGFLHIYSGAQLRIANTFDVDPSAKTEDRGNEAPR